MINSPKNCELILKQITEDHFVHHKDHFKMICKVYREQGDIGYELICDAYEKAGLLEVTYDNPGLVTLNTICASAGDDGFVPLMKNLLNEAHIKPQETERLTSNPNIPDQYSLCQKDIEGGINAKKDISNFQSQIAQYQAQLTDSQNTIDSLQKELSFFTSTVLEADTPNFLLGQVFVGNSVRLPIEMNQYDQVQGALLGDLQLLIQDSSGKVVEDFGQSNGKSFVFTAMSTGKYSIVLKNKWNREHKLPNSLHNLSQKTTVKYSISNQGQE
jgi:hypothetical protein